MMGIHAYGLFLASGILMNVMPGQDTMFIIGRSLTGGSRAGVAAALGVTVGSLGHTLAAALGLSAILATSAFAFTAVKLVGAAYLLYLGARLLLGREPTGAPGAGTATAPAAPSAAFAQGIVTNILNPKVALFFLAFLPQFIDPASESKTLAFLVLGATFVTTGLAWCLVLAVAAARLQRFFASHPGARILLDRTVGALFVGLGARLAWAR